MGDTKAVWRFHWYSAVCTLTPLLNISWPSTNGSGLGYYQLPLLWETCQAPDRMNGYTVLYELVAELIGSNNSMCGKIDVFMIHIFFTFPILALEAHGTQPTEGNVVSATHDLRPAWRQCMGLATMAPWSESNIILHVSQYILTRSWVQPYRYIKHLQLSIGIYAFTLGYYNSMQLLESGKRRASYSGICIVFFCLENGTFLVRHILAYCIWLGWGNLSCISNSIFSKFIMEANSLGWLLSSPLNFWLVYIPFYKVK